MATISELEYLKLSKGQKLAYKFAHFFTESLPNGLKSFFVNIGKALAGAALHPGCVVLAADTLVALEDTPLGKPRDEAEAFRMLRGLSGREHHVYTGVCCVAPDGSLHAGLDTSRVRFSLMTDVEIRAYIATGEPMDKAGAYALQGGAAAWIESLQGSPSGVIGLPLFEVRCLLSQAGYDFDTP